jgi:hypothetical protein
MILTGSVFGCLIDSFEYLSSSDGSEEEVDILFVRRVRVIFEDVEGVCVRGGEGEGSEWSY